MRLFTFEYICILYFEVILMETLKSLWDLVVSFVSYNILNFLKGIQWKDILDILILSVILYGIYCFVRDRRAFKLMLGLGLILLLSVLGDFFNLKAVGFVFGDFRQLGVIAILIIFQPELRAALEKVGGESLKNFKGRLDTEESAAIHAAISEVTSAAESFSQTKTGALIVFERTTRLGDVIRTGTVVDAKTSQFLLGNIFYDKAPLHDGAVIIREGRVHAAGCFLPLSSNNEIIKELGTRHRAAIGMSENSDAVVLVVSEENGIISVAVDGNLKRGFNRKSLEKYLVSLLANDDKKNITDRVKGKFRKSIYTPYSCSIIGRPRPICC
jgi:diadenylate cyclase